MDFFSQEQGLIKLYVLVKPNARQSEILGVVDGRLVVAIASKPVKGAANKELVSFLSLYFKIPKSKISVEKGGQSRFKQVLLPFAAELRKYLDGITTGN